VGRFHKPYLHCQGQAPPNQTILPAQKSRTILRMCSHLLIDRKTFYETPQRLVLGVLMGACFDDIRRRSVSRSDSGMRVISG